MPIFPRTGIHFELHVADWALIDENDLLQRSISISFKRSQAQRRPQVCDLGHAIRICPRFCLSIGTLQPSAGKEKTELRRSSRSSWIIALLMFVATCMDVKFTSMKIFIIGKQRLKAFGVTRLIQVKFEKATRWSPQPPLLRPRHAACVIVVQAPQDHLASSLVSVFEGLQHLSRPGGERHPGGRQQKWRLASFGYVASKRALSPRCLRALRVRPGPKPVASRFPTSDALEHSVHWNSSGALPP